MALTRKQMEEMGLTEAQIDGIVDALTEGGLDREDLLRGGDWATRYEALQQEYDAYRAEVEQAAMTEKLRAAYRQLLQREHIDPRRIDVILRATQFDDMAMDEDGNLMDVERLIRDIHREWADFIVTRELRGARVGQPPARGRVTRTREDIMSIPDAAERQKAISENHELFGF